ncbi:HEAT repeat domain-containing protein [Streptomyces albus]|uniref:HEAT repeat domain-containing protein n=1 Tax=Streptomyces albus TaxID=1888 RepID=UPI0005647DE2|nr:HEAT repeat domain-containing protein [Streptomyces albus]
MTDFVKRIVIKARFTSDDVDFVSMQRGWILQHHRKAEAGASIDIWVTSDRRTEIHQVDDRHIGTRYFTLRGPGSREVAEHIRQDCELWSISEALGELERVRARGEKLICIYAAALAAGEGDGERITQSFRDLVRDPDAGIRQSVIIATGYFPYPGLVDLVRDLRDSDPAAHVRKNAQILLDGLSVGK